MSHTVIFDEAELHALTRWAKIKIEEMKAKKRSHHYPRFINWEELELRGAMAEYGFSRLHPELKSQWSWNLKDGGDHGIDYVYRGYNIDVKGTGYHKRHMCSNGLSWKKGTSKTDIYVAGRVDLKLGRVEYVGWIHAPAFYQAAEFVQKDRNRTAHYRMAFEDMNSMWSFDRFTRYIPRAEEQLRASS